MFNDVIYVQRWNIYVQRWQIIWSVIKHILNDDVKWQKNMSSDEKGIQ